MWLLGLFFLSACVPHQEKNEVDKLNDISYGFHYRNLDSTDIYAQKALYLAVNDAEGRAEALNNMAFVSTMRMNFKRAYEQLAEVGKQTNNQIELLVADVQLMRLCQRESKNKEFYEHRENAINRMHRIQEEEGRLSARERNRLLYAKSEFSIVTSTYYYYVGLEQPSIDALQDIDVKELERDTAQYLAYLYNVGAGGIITKGTQTEINQKEFDYLLRCFMLARQCGLSYWEANSMQAISEHLQENGSRIQLIGDNLPAMKFLNTDNMPDSLLAGNLAEKSLEMFRRFGDVYQTAGAFRTLASCYMGINDYPSAIVCLNQALETNKAIEQAPDLVASIREQMSVAYAAINDKPNSDYNRNLYLDLQEQTRQDRELEARAELLERSSRQLNIMISAVIAVIVLVVVLLLVFDYLRRKDHSGNDIERLLTPLQEWKTRNIQQTEELNNRYEELSEAYEQILLHVANNKKRNIENRAKVFLVNSILPFIDRMLHEIKCLRDRNNKENEGKRNERYEYISELCDKINDYNGVLTQWIQLRQGELSLHIESFPLQQLFDTLKKSHMSFLLKGIQLQIEPTEAVVKADRILTLFMMNTIADNARKFTPKGGKVRVWAEEQPDYVEISIQDNGEGMDETELSTLFHHHLIVDTQSAEEVSKLPQTVSHGFGLMNCKGIIDKYKKTSSIFKVCVLGAESRKHEGSRFYFRLPKGVRKALVLVALLMGFELQAGAAVQPQAKDFDTLCALAANYADSAYYSNIHGTFQLTMVYVEQARKVLNQAYHSLYPQGTDTLMALGSISAESPEVRWFHQSLPFDYSVILDFRNEMAVASLAIHEWNLYKYNNKVYTLLFKETSADATLGEYVSKMQRSETNKQVAIVVLIVLLLVLLVAYYLLYYRHRIAYRFCVDRLSRMNEILLTDGSPKEKLNKIASLADGKYPPELQQVVNQILQTLQESVDVSQAQHTNIELAEDELHRAQYEDDKLHISNSVLDNCLSTLKHETMYYPSRIRVLIDGHDINLAAIDELAKYYKELYSLLSTQAMLQVDTIKFRMQVLEARSVLPPKTEVEGPSLYVLGDYDLLRYMFDILRQQMGGKHLHVEISEKDHDYVVYTVLLPMINLGEQQCQQLFLPSMSNLPYLLCRQIVREHGQQTARRGCGITAEKCDEGGIKLKVTLSLTKSDTQ